jgi:hypothetical protein
MGRFEHGRSSFNDHVRDNDKDNDPRDRGRFRYLGLHGLSAGGALSGFTARRLAIRARRSVLSEASAVRRVSWRAFRASAADLPPGDKRLLSEAPVPQTSINDEPAVEVAHPPSERLDSSSAAAANAVIFRLFDTYATPMDGRSTSIAGQL